MSFLESEEGMDAMLAEALAFIDECDSDGKPRQARAAEKTAVAAQQHSEKPRNRIKPNVEWVIRSAIPPSCSSARRRAARAEGPGAGAGGASEAAAAASPTETENPRGEGEKLKNPERGGRQPRVV